MKRRASKVAHDRPRPSYFTVQPRPQPTALNWFFILWNLGTRRLFSYLCVRPNLHTTWVRCSFLITYWTSIKLKPKCFSIFSLSTHGIVSTKLIFPNFMNHIKSNKRFIIWDTFIAIELFYGEIKFSSKSSNVKSNDLKIKRFFQDLFGICVRLSSKQVIPECYLGREIKTLNNFSNYPWSIKTFFRQWILI